MIPVRFAILVLAFSMLHALRAEDPAPAPGASPVPVTKTFTKGTLAEPKAGGVGEVTTESGAPEQNQKNVVIEAQEVERQTELKTGVAQEPTADQASLSSTVQAGMTGSSSGSETSSASSTETSKPADATAASPSGQDDIIPLPADLAIDAKLLDLPMDSGPVDASTDSYNVGDIPPMDIPSAMPAVPLGESARAILVRYKELRVQIEKDPEVAALRAKADNASTPEDSRAALREYYRLLFKKMRKADPSLTARCDAMEAAYLARLSQNRVEPTIPRELPPVPQPLPGSPVALAAASVKPSPTPAPKASPKPKPSPTPKASPSTKPSPIPKASPSPSPKISTMPSPAATSTGKLQAKPSPTASPAPTAEATPKSRRFLPNIWPLRSSPKATPTAQDTSAPKPTPTPLPMPTATPKAKPTPPSR